MDSDKRYGAIASEDEAARQLKKKGISSPQRVGIPPSVGREQVVGSNSEYKNESGHVLGNVTRASDDTVLDDSALRRMSDMSIKNVKDAEDQKTRTYWLQYGRTK